MQRTARNGANAGRSFWGCQAYPTGNGVARWAGNEPAWGCAVLRFPCAGSRFTPKGVRMTVAVPRYPATGAPQGPTWRGSAASTSTGQCFLSSGCSTLRVVSLTSWAVPGPVWGRASTMWRVSMKAVGL